MRTNQHAFSLVELSIVLVILGLLTGGILAGQSLIRAAELRSVSVEYSKYRAAIMSFRDKYLALPGDMRNATQFWGTQHATPANCHTSASTTTATCNGNGDGFIWSADGGTTASEKFRAFQHLANAGLIEGTYSGVAGANGIHDFSPGINQPSSKVSNANWCLAHWISPGDAENYAMDYGNFMWIGADVAGANSGCGSPSFKPEEVWNIDTKLDDGRPASGNVVAGNWDQCTTSASFSDISGEYALSVISKECWIILRHVDR